MTALAPEASARPAVPNTIPLKFTNNSGRGDKIYVYTLGTLLSTGQQGWADASGTFHPWPAGGNPPTPAPDASIAGPAGGQSMTIRIPKLSGRVYFSYGQKIDFRLTTGGLVQPAVQNPSDPNRNILFNWSEFTLDDSGLYINSTQVDMFSAPYAVGVQGADGSTKTTGHLKPGGYNGVFNALRAQGGGWSKLIQTRPDGTVLRALSPGHGIEAGALPANAMDDYTNRVWQKYAGTTLTVTPFADRPSVKYFGRGSTATALTATAAMAAIGVLGVWEPSMDTLSQVLAAVFVTLVLGFAIGIWAARSTRLERMMRPVLDMFQTMPQFVYLIPVVALFGVGRAPAAAAAIVYALPAVIRITTQGLRSVDPAALESARSLGATQGQQLRQVQLPLARPALLLAVNQGVVLVLAVVVIGGLVGSGALGYDVLFGLAQGDLATGLVAGAAIVCLGLMLDRVTQPTSRREKKGA
ncbi:beta-1,3-glucanase family protein [Streptomyces asiaticus]